MSAETTHADHNCQDVETNSGTGVTLADVIAELKAIRKALSRNEAAILRARDAAAFCGLSPATWARMAAARRVPKPVRLGGCVGWSREILLRWISLGCPDQRMFESMAKQR